MRKLRTVHILLAVLLFGVELVIALTLQSGLLRTWGGDLLVVMLIYFTMRAVFPGPAAWKVACGVLLFAFATEITQYFHLIRHLGLQDQLVARLILGNTFEATDLIAYTLGVLLALVIDEHLLRRYCARAD